MTNEEPTQLDIARGAAKAENAGHWPTVAAILTAAMDAAYKDKATAGAAADAAAAAALDAAESARDATHAADAAWTAANAAEVAYANATSAAADALAKWEAADRAKRAQEFKQKYFDNNSYWVNKENYKKLQEIALEVGCLCHTGKAEIIEWHVGFNNLGFRTYEKNNNVTVFQKELFLPYNHTATDFNEMLSVYDNVATCV